MNVSALVYEIQNSIKQNGKYFWCESIENLNDQIMACVNTSA